MSPRCSSVSFSGPYGGVHFILWFCGVNYQPTPFGVHQPRVCGCASYEQSGNADSVGGAVMSWVNEKQDYDYSSNTCAEGKVCGHFSQVVWRDSKRLGCAQAECNNGWTFVICNYDPPGNYVGQKPY